ncbi:hypothetical protein INT45_013073 [Circinella minor]|uniref:ATP-dependent DNA helicase n=1 Tax=Circinella minor TaxID=1195481 RepID=A0A8H7RZT9_9FUNG|nr:hypothetical protein INT45_013073 [Circinella minor]
MHSVRPSTMDNVTSALFVAREEENYNGDNENSDDDNKVNDNGGNNACNQENGDDNNNNNKVICFHGYRLAQDPLNYYRELVMLYSPRRDEEIDILLVDCEMKFRQNQEALAKCREFTKFNDATLMEALENVEAAHDDAKEEKDPQRLLANPLDEYEMYKENVDVMAETGGYERVPYQETITHPTRLDYDEYEAFIALLNTEQRGFVYHMLTRWFDENVQIRDREKPSVLLCAPTGMAAYNIQGHTLHSAFHLPVDQYGDNLTEPSSDVANTIRTCLAELRVVIMDDISMVPEKKTFDSSISGCKTSLETSDLLVDVS